MSINNSAAILLFDYKKRILMQHRTEDALHAPGYWSFFGGAIEKGENPDVAVRRECLEELDYSLENPKLILVNKFNGETRFIFAEKYNKFKSLELLEGQAMEWFSIDDALKLKIIEGDDEILNQIKGKY